MKMKLYYVVKKANGFYDKHDFDYVAGPFSFAAAYEYKNAAYKNYDLSNLWLVILYRSLVARSV